MEHVEAEYRYVPWRREHEIILWYVKRRNFQADWIGIVGKTLKQCMALTAQHCKSHYLVITKMDIDRTKVDGLPLFPFPPDTRRKPWA
jgi:hypothetical protein